MIPVGVRIFAATAPTDMRRGFVGLAEAARERLGHDPSSGALFVFWNKRRDRLKLLWHDRTGWCLLYKGLPHGFFRIPETDPSVRALSVVGRIDVVANGRVTIVQNRRGGRAEVREVAR